MTQPMVPLPETDAPALPEWSEVAAITLSSEATTDALAANLAAGLEPGDILLLSGALGAGKTHLARALIRAATGNPAEPVPSPSFTLVQTYDTNKGDVWHADLYRLSDPAEVQELGLEEAFSHAICLIEWPDRFAPDWPEDAVLLHLDRHLDDTRTARLLAPTGSALAARLAAAMQP